ncbi:multicopper oxidase family protein [Granulicella arctica]|uniref:FtsP/CotA-like multicopper oxidase with cupredoxin domain n=1 Tax=Granulicella arctica TaxID=940613 RepID=A0A7Y9PJX3_9BACT|nr:multicopper oxidase domain-containing protein [Granulicella arctica]NYF81119.1 FtsP/CotA-like multicopper oxidase with cupredoxin domain [Granulicella arctica]
MNRRSFLSSAGALLAARSLNALAPLQSSQGSGNSAGKADHFIRIEPCTLDIGHGVTIKTTAYNGQVPGPLLRLREGVRVTIDVTNAGTSSDLVHWHGLAIDSLNDGAMEEGSPMIAAGSTHRYTFTPKPSGTRWYHTHAAAYGDLSVGTYSGQFGFLLIEGKEQPARYDQEINLAIHHWEPSFVPMVETMREQSSNMPLTTGSDVGYKYATINAHMLGAGEPIRVKQGQRVLMRLLNASATENVVLALPGHSFKIIAMDGNPVPNPRTVEVLSLAVAERVDAVVEMNAPGVWVLGSTLQKSRQMGLGIVVEYAGKTGDPVWKDPPAVEWDYTQFANTAEAPAPDETFVLTFRDIGSLHGSQFDTWTINNKSWPDTDPLLVQQGKRYRMVLRNGSGDQHPIHLHRHTFEVTRIGKKPISGLMKDVINVMPLDTVEVDFIANNPGGTLMHCHQQLHMDYGFMQLIKYKG